MQHNFFRKVKPKGVHGEPPSPSVAPKHLDPNPFHRHVGSDGLVHKKKHPARTAGTVPAGFRKIGGR